MYSYVYFEKRLNLIHTIVRASGKSTVEKCAACNKLNSKMCSERACSSACFQFIILPQAESLLQFAIFVRVNFYAR